MINCNEPDFIRNESDSILDSFLPKNYIADSVQMFINTQVNQNTNSYSKSVIELCNRYKKQINRSFSKPKNFEFILNHINSESNLSTKVIPVKMDLLMKTNIHQWMEY
jgi:hypothetical protein